MQMLDMVVHACNPRTWEAEQGIRSLGYTVKFRKEDSKARSGYETRARHRGKEKEYPILKLTIKPL